MANLILSCGLKEGDYVMSMLNRRWEYWVLTIACHKIGVTIIPATHLLTAKDIAYRINESKAKLLFATAEEDVIEHIALALPKCPELKKIFYTKNTKHNKSTLYNSSDAFPSTSFHWLCCRR